jgi:hypothetical protein
VALTITAPAPGLVGPGSAITVHTDLVGPFPVDDFVSVAIVPALSGNGEAFGDATCFGLSTVTVVLGIFTNSNIAFGLNRPHAAGASVSLLVNWRHANGASVETATFSAGWIYDPVGALHQLIMAATSQNSDIRKILLAVRRQFPNNA